MRRFTPLALIAAGCLALWLLVEWQRPGRGSGDASGNAENPTAPDSRRVRGNAGSPRQRTASLRVEGPDGPVVGAKAVFFATKSKSGWRSVSDARGGLAVEARDGALDLLVQAPGYIPQRHQGLTIDDDTVLQLERGLELQLAFRDERDRLFNDVTAKLIPAGPNPGPGAWAGRAISLRRTLRPPHNDPTWVRLVRAGWTRVEATAWCAMRSKKAARLAAALLAEPQRQAKNGVVRWRGLPKGDYRWELVASSAAIAIRPPGKIQRRGRLNLRLPPKGLSAAFALETNTTFEMKAYANTLLDVTLAKSGDLEASGVKVYATHSVDSELRLYPLRERGIGAQRDRHSVRITKLRPGKHVVEARWRSEAGAHWQLQRIEIEPGKNAATLTASSGRSVSVRLALDPPPPVELAKKLRTRLRVHSRFFQGDDWSMHHRQEVELRHGQTLTLHGLPDRGLWIDAAATHAASWGYFVDFGRFQNGVTFDRVRRLIEISGHWKRTSPLTIHVSPARSRTDVCLYHPATKRLATPSISRGKGKWPCREGILSVWATCGRHGENLYAHTKFMHDGHKELRLSLRPGALCEGTVRKPSGQLVTDKTIVFDLNADGEWIDSFASASTDSSGKFRLMGLPPHSKLRLVGESTAFAIGEVGSTTIRELTTTRSW